MKNYHCCATCNHFLTVKNERGVQYQCARLGFKTKPSYQFDCWNPKEHIKKLMEKQKEKN